jgi:hypothetical protein
MNWDRAEAIINEFDFFAAVVAKCHKRSQWLNLFNRPSGRTLPESLFPLKYSVVKSGIRAMSINLTPGRWRIRLMPGAMVVRQKTWLEAGRGNAQKGMPMKKEGTLNL